MHEKDKMMLVSWCLLLVIIRLLDQGILGGEGVPPMRVCKWYPNFLTFGVSSFIRMMMKPMVLLFTGGKRKLQISPKDQRCFSGTSQTILLRIKRLFLKAGVTLCNYVTLRASALMNPRLRFII